MRTTPCDSFDSRLLKFARRVWLFRHTDFTRQSSAPMRTCRYVGKLVAGWIPSVYGGDWVLGRSPNHRCVCTSSDPRVAHRRRRSLVDDAGPIRDRSGAVVSIRISANVRSLDDRERANGSPNPDTPGLEDSARNAISVQVWPGVRSGSRSLAFPRARQAILSDHWLPEGLSVSRSVERPA